MLALFKECAHALLLVGGLEAGAEVLLLDHDSAVDVDLKALVDGLLGCAHRDGRVGGDLRSEADFSGELTLDYASKVAESAALSARTPENALCTQYGVSVKGTKEDIWNYMQAVADIDEAVMINSVSIADYTFGAAGETATTTDEEGNQVSVTVGGGENGESDVQFVISIYSVYTMTKPNTDMPK